MTRSMTGFGQAGHSDADWRCSVEVRSVNSRYLDIRLRLPRRMAALEEPIKARIKALCSRGKIDGVVSLSPAGGGGSLVPLTPAQLEELAQMVRHLSTVLGQPVNLGLSDLLSLGETLGEAPSDEIPPQVEALVMKTAEDAIGRMVQMRETEGEALLAVLAGHTATVAEIVQEIEPMTAGIPERYAQRLRENLARLSQGNLPDADRIAQEIVIFADRCDVTEEFNRIHTHLAHLRDIISTGGVIGRKIDFLLQELNREANTLGVKANDADISARVVVMKSELEKIREQIQNME